MVSIYVTVSLPGPPILFLPLRFFPMTNNRIYIDGVYAIGKVIQNILIFIEQKQRDNNI